MSPDIGIDPENGILYFPRLQDHFGVRNLSTYDNSIWGNRSIKYEIDREGAERVANMDRKMVELLGVSNLVSQTTPLDSTILRLDREMLSVLHNSGHDPEGYNTYKANCNALITPLRNYSIEVCPSDCAVAIAVHPESEYMASIHLGSKEVFTSIYEDALDLMFMRAGIKSSEKCEIFIFPHISPKNFTYGTDFVAKMEKAVPWIMQYTVDIGEEDKVGFDFIGRFKDQLGEKYGIEKIYESGICTYDSAQEDRLYSYRLTKSDPEKHPRGCFSVAVARTD